MKERERERGMKIKGEEAVVTSEVGWTERKT